jgi:hypothetical protein
MARLLKVSSNNSSLSNKVKMAVTMLLSHNKAITLEVSVVMQRQLSGTFSSFDNDATLFCAAKNFHLERASSRAEQNFRCGQ